MMQRKVNKGQAMCNCKNDELETDGKYLYVEDYKNVRYEINFCPICGENVQPERSKREDCFTTLNDLNETKTYIGVRLFNEISREMKRMRCSEQCGDMLRDK
jgi:hypothetical protein